MGFSSGYTRSNPAWLKSRVDMAGRTRFNNNATGSI